MTNPQEFRPPDWGRDWERWRAEAQALVNKAMRAVIDELVEDREQEDAATATLGAPENPWGPRRVD